MDRLRNTGDDNNQNNDYLQHDDDHQGLSLLVELADQSWALPTNFAVPDTLDNLIRISILGMNSVTDLVRGPSVCWTSKNVSPLYGMPYFIKKFVSCLSLSQLVFLTFIPLM